MAKQYKNVGTTFTALRNELIAYYGTDVTIHYYTDTAIVFSFSWLPDIVIKLVILIGAYNRFMGGWIGTAWTSGTTIVNEVQFKGTTTSNNGATSSTTAIETIFGPETCIVIFQAARGVGAGNETMILDKMANSDFMILGIAGIGWSNTNSKAINLSDKSEHLLRTYGYYNIISALNYSIQDTHFVNALTTSNAEIYLDSFGNFQTLKNVKLSSCTALGVASPCLVTSQGVFLPAMNNMHVSTGLALNLYISLT